MSLWKKTPDYLPAILLLVAALPFGAWVFRITASDSPSQSGESVSYTAAKTERSPLASGAARPSRYDSSAQSSPLPYMKADNYPQRKRSETTAGSGSAETEQSGSSGDPKKDRESFLAGATKHYLTKFVVKNLHNPRVVKFIFDNPLVVKGFMSRATVKKALASKNSLRAYMSDSSAINAFLAKPGVKTALGNQAIADAMASSAMAAAIMNSPAMLELRQDRAAMNEISGILAANPNVAALMADPAIVAVFSRNPKLAMLASGAR